MISQQVRGCPRPVGSEFRQRRVMAESPHRGRGAFDDHDVPWIVSVVDTVSGPIMEAHAYHQPTAIVATDMDHHSIGQDVVFKTRDLLDADGWKTLTVQECQVKGCANPLPIWTEVSRGIGPAECLPCQMRTVLACAECGAPDPGSWIGRENLLARSLCLHCAGWQDRIADPPDVITDEWQTYGIGNGRGPSSCKGFGGAHWVITFHDGSEINTDDLWMGGKIPPWFQDRYTPNASVRSAEPGGR